MNNMNIKIFRARGQLSNKIGSRSFNNIVNKIPDSMIRRFSSEQLADVISLIWAMKNKTR